MEFKKAFLTIVFFIAFFTAATYGQDASISGPILGFTVDRDATAIAPIFGVLGASVLGEPLDFGIDFRSAIISPEQNYALAVRNDNGATVILKPSGTQSILELPVSVAGASRIAISPKGLAAAFFNGSSASLRTVRGLPDLPEIVHEFDASIFRGELTTMAVSDDGAITLASFVDENGQTATWVITSSGSLWQAPAGRPSSLAFLPHRYDVIVGDADAQEVFLLLDLNTTGNRVPLISLNGAAGSPVHVAVSQDGSLFAVASDAQKLTIVDAATHTSTVLDCSCVPNALRRLSGNGVFLLDGLPSDLLHVLEASTDPRVVVIPATRKPAEVEFEP
jgi:WD40 repeat protein